MSRSVEDHLLPEESVRESFVGPNWAWIATDRRLIKYRRNDAGAEQMSDLSYDEIAGVDVGHSGKSTRWLYYAAGFGVLSLALMTSTPIVGFLLLLPAAYCVWRWATSEESYFEFRGRLAGDDPADWRIDRTSVDDEDDVNALVRAVREQVV